MLPTVVDLLTRLKPDRCRESTPFSPEMAEANERIFEAGDDSDAIAGILRQWLQRHQPCLFGRIAARRDRVTYCILTERDLRQSDSLIQSKIQDARLGWTRAGFSGQKSGFVILAAAPAIALATPNDDLRALAQRLCSLYLLQEIDVDRAYHDEIFLEKPDQERSTWKWLAGVNYFCANGDGRWWQDHRMPGGMAFSVNSVGHLAKTAAVALEIEDESEQQPNIHPKTAAATRIDSLGRALEFAMRTIGMASDGASGRATELWPLSDTDGHSVRCPVELPSNLAGKDFRQYRSYYHTDFTLPSEYFLSDIQRPQHCSARSMDLTYLHHADLSNPDYLTMGVGRRIRGAPRKARRIQPISQPIESSKQLIHALNA